MGINDIMIQVATNVGLIIFVLIIVNAITKGFFFKYVKVWASRGKYVMVQVRHPIMDYFTIGEVKGDQFLFKDRTTKKGQKKPVVFKSGCVYRLLGINFIKIDEEKSVYIMPDMKLVSGYDHVKISNWLTRALTEPKSKEQKQLMNIIIGICVLLIILSIVAVFNIFGILNIVKDMSARMVTNNITGVI